MSEAMKPCPFCGGEAAIIPEDRTWIECLDCPSKAEVGPFDTEAEAIAAWNTRHTESPATAREVEELRAEVERLREALEEAVEQLWHLSKEGDDNYLVKRLRVALASKGEAA